MLDAGWVVDVSLDCLWRWAKFSEAYWWPAPDRPGLGCFGSGTNDWGVQTNQKYLAAMAVLATDSGARDRHGYTTDQALQRALAALRFSLASHVTGDYRCTDGTQWGRTWISGLGIERMLHGVDRVETHLTDADRQAIRRMLTDEADWLCTDYHRGSTKGVRAGLWHGKGNNDPESNIWNGAICARAALYYGDHPHAGQWIERAHEFFINGISIPADATDETVLGGKPVRQRHVGANFFPHYALDHHAYLNVGYMVICLSNIAMLHYGLARGGRPVPETLYWHAKDLWALVRRLLFADGRLLRIGGDSRIRYCYCQDYAVPMLVFAADYWQDPHAMDLLRGAVEVARREQSLSADGRFLCSRLEEMVRKSPWYYCRLEADRAVVLSQAADWLPGLAVAPPAAQDYESSVAGGWGEEEHGAVFHRSPTRMASWSWRACENPQGLCLPPSCGDLAEWQENLAGRVHGLGRDIQCALRAHTQADFPGGFVTCGSFADRSSPEIREGWHDEELTTHHIAFAALPDDHTCVRLEYAVAAPRRVYLGGWEGVKLEIPNDVFNGNKRRYVGAAGELELPARLGSAKVKRLGSPWVNIDGVIGLVCVYGDKTWTIRQRGRRIGGHAVGSILTDTLCLQYRAKPCDVYGPKVLLDNGCVILASAGADETRAVSEGAQAQRLACRCDGGACRAVRVQGRDGRQYVVAANFGQQDCTAKIDLPAGEWLDLAGGQAVGGEGLALPAGQARVLARALQE